MPSYTQTDTELVLRLPAVDLHFPLAAGDLLGLGPVGADGLAWRDGSQLLRPWLRTVNGVQYSRFQLDRVEEAAGEIRIHTTAYGEQLHESAYGDQYGDHQFMVRQDQGPTTAALTWIIRPERQTIGGLDYAGFSYAWRFESADETLHRMISQATWEIGGDATGNTILSQGQVTPAIYDAEPATHFTSACLQSLQRFGDPTAMSFQFVPRWGAHQCFDFIAHDAGSLLGYWPERNDTRSFLQKNPGESVIFVVDAMHWQATGQVTSPRKCLLFAAADGLSAVDRRNRWYHAHAFATGAVRELFGITRSRPLPERMVGYKQRLMDDGSFELLVGEQWVKSQDWLAAIADTLLPDYAARGVRRVITEPIVESDPTQRGGVTKLGHSGLHNDLNIGSVCCVHRYRPAEFFGGMDAWRYFCRTAHGLGLEVGHWIGPHLAYHAPILQENPDWMLRAFTSITHSGGYPNYMLACVNWHTPIRQWILDDLAAMRQEAGLDYVWFDSIANLGMLPIDFSKEMQTNTEPLLEFMADLQRLGIGHIAVEGMSAAAMSGAHIMDHAPGHDGGVQWIAGQNSWLWYEGAEDMLIGQQPRVWVHKSHDAEAVRRRHFRCLANACVPEIQRYTDQPWHRDQIDAYLTVEPLLGSREILPENRGVHWTHDQGDVLFTFAPVELPLAANARVELWRDGELRPYDTDGAATLRTDAWQIYRITRG